MYLLVCFIFFFFLEQHHHTQFSVREKNDSNVFIHLRHSAQTKLVGKFDICMGKAFRILSMKIYPDKKIFFFDSLLQ